MDILSFEPVVVQLADALRRRGWLLTAAESCTGGLIAAACTALAGSSDWFERGFVTYSNEAKTQMLGVDAALIASAHIRAIPHVVGGELLQLLITQTIDAGVADIPVLGRGALHHQ